MKTHEKKETAGGDLHIQVATRRPKRFKAGAELSGSINLSVELTEEETEREQSFAVSIRLQEENCES
jgi:hypothetical protein